MGKQFAQSGVFGYHEGSHPGGTTARPCQADSTRTVDGRPCFIGRQPDRTDAKDRRRTTSRDTPSTPLREYSPCPSPDFARSHHDQPKIAVGNIKNRVRKRNLRPSFVVRLPYPPRKNATTPASHPKRMRPWKKTAHQARGGKKPGTDPGRACTGHRRCIVMIVPARDGGEATDNPGFSEPNNRFGTHGAGGTPDIRSSARTVRQRGATSHPHRRRRNAAEELDA